VTASACAHCGDDPALSFWPTPREVAEDLVFMTLNPSLVAVGNDPRGVPQIRVLEPSAGEGDLVRVVREHLPYAHVTGVEPNAYRAARLRSQPGLVDEVAEGALEDYLATVARSTREGWAPFDLVLMNPPFTLPGRREVWAEHVLAVCHAQRLLAPGAVVGAIVPHIVLTGKSRLVRAVRTLLGPDCVRHCTGALWGQHGRIEPGARGAFDPVGAAVSTALLWVWPPEVTTRTEQLELPA
jgi:hypothetical protein